jgi:hypothetical protein
MPSRVTRNSARGAHPLASFRDTPLTHVRMLYNTFVKVLFAHRTVGDMHWTDDETTSEIYISDESPVNGDIVGMRPCISFTRSAVQFYSLGMDDMMSYDFETGQKTKGVLVPGVMSINCCSRVDLESENIAFWVAENLWILREKLMGTAAFFEIGRQPQVSAPSSAEGIVTGDCGREFYCTTVSSPFQFSRTSQFTPLNRQVVNELALAIQARVQPLQCRGQGLGPVASPNGDVPLSFQMAQPNSFYPEASDARGRTPDFSGQSAPEPPLQPHPLNPAMQVRVRAVRPFRAAVRPPMMGGRSIPIAEHDCVESETSPPFRTKV